MSISLFNAEAVAGTGGFPSNFRSYTRTFARFLLCRLFQGRFKITETRAQVLFLLPFVPMPPPSQIERAFSHSLVYLLVSKRLSSYFSLDSSHSENVASLVAMMGSHEQTMMNSD